MEKWLMETIFWSALVTFLFNVVLEVIRQIVHQKERKKQEERLQAQDDKIEKAEKRERYFYPTSLHLSFSKETFPQEVSDMLVITNQKHIRVQAYQGFVVKTVAFHALEGQETLFFAEPTLSFEGVKKMQEQADSDHLMLTIPAGFTITEASDHFLYSATFYLFTDFVGKKHLYLVVEIIRVPGAGKRETQIIQSFIFNEDYALLSQNPHYEFMPTQFDVAEELRREAGAVVQRYLKTYRLLLEDLA
ncbi:hypothetical protein [Streptococcus cuniculi]|uniref:Uncharacterized protein n=1 Tax=Streptococcus cuniculi TaxID=1432788 RepID=A0A4Y9J9I3_9STRE|nr:hypothetical protein [Streptococcus cuniculi]MBF0779347.1 hypothetical protein [Streptococcus cuniculi]TFU96644.1 hypothetical protein E4T82_11640 [Streptococcus cuniculi]